MKSIESGRLNPGTVPAFIYTAMGESMKASVKVDHHPTEIRTRHFPSTSLGHNRHISSFRIVTFHSLELAPSSHAETYYFTHRRLAPGLRKSRGMPVPLALFVRWHLPLPNTIFACQATLSVITLRNWSLNTSLPCKTGLLRHSQIKFYNTRGKKRRLTESLTLL